MDPKHKLILMVVLVVAAVGALVLVVRPKTSPLGKRAGATLCVCAACGQEVTQTLKSVPDTCPSCHEKQLYPAVKCPHCGAANALLLIGGPQGRQPMLTCRQCRKQFAPGAAQQAGSAQ